MLLTRRNLCSLRPPPAQGSTGRQFQAKSLLPLPSLPPFSGLTLTSDDKSEQDKTPSPQGTPYPLSSLSARLIDGNLPIAAHCRHTSLRSLASTSGRCRPLSSPAGFDTICPLRFQQGYGLASHGTPHTSLCFPVCPSSRLHVSMSEPSPATCSAGSP